MIDLDWHGLDATPVSTDPFPHVMVPAFVRTAALGQVVSELPLFSRGGSFPIGSVRTGAHARQLFEALEGPRFRGAVARKFGLALDDAPVMTTLRGASREKDGRIHTDSTAKRVTVLLYLNPASEAWARHDGCLRLLRSANDLDDFAVEVPPTDGALLVFPNGPTTFHGHKQFVGRRYVVQLNYMTTDSERHAARCGGIGGRPSSSAWPPESHVANATAPAVRSGLPVLRCSWPKWPRRYGARKPLPSGSVRRISKGALSGGARGRRPGLRCALRGQRRIRQARRRLAVLPAVSLAVVAEVQPARHAGPAGSGLRQWRLGDAAGRPGAGLSRVRFQRRSPCRQLGKRHGRSGPVPYRRRTRSWRTTQAAHDGIICTEVLEHVGTRPRRGGALVAGPARPCAACRISRTRRTCGTSGMRTRCARVTASLLRHRFACRTGDGAADPGPGHAELGAAIALGADRAAPGPRAAGREQLRLARRLVRLQRPCGPELLAHEDPVVEEAGQAAGDEARAAARPRRSRARPSPGTAPGLRPSAAKRTKNASSTPVRDRAHVAEPPRELPQGGGGGPALEQDRKPAGQPRPVRARLAVHQRRRVAACGRSRRSAGCGRGAARRGSRTPCRRAAGRAGPPGRATGRPTRRRGGRAG